MKATLILAAALVLGGCRSNGAGDDSPPAFAKLRLVPLDDEGSVLGPVSVRYRKKDGDATGYVRLDAWTCQRSDRLVVLNEPGAYEIVLDGHETLRSSGGMTIVIEDDVTPSDEVATFEVVIPEGGRIHLNVRDPEGRFLPDVRVRVDEVGGRRIDPGLGAGHASATEFYEVVEAAETATSRLRLPPGDYTMSLSHDAYRTERLEVTIENALDTTVNVTMRAE